MIKHRVIRFLLAGGSAATTEYASFILLNLKLGDSRSLYSQAASFACGFVVSFLLAKRWVFRSSGRWQAELPKYIALALANLLLGTMIFMILSEIIGFNIFLAKLIVMLLIAAWNYIVASRAIFTTNNADHRKLPPM